MLPALVAVLLAFLASRSIGSASKRARAAKAVSVFLLCLGLIGIMAYLWEYSRYVVTDSLELDGEPLLLRIVVGTELKDGVSRNGATDLDLLRDNLYEPYAVWTPESVRNARIVLVGAFVLSFFSLTFGAAMLAPLACDQGGGDFRKL